MVTGNNLAELHAQIYESVIDTGLCVCFVCLFCLFFFFFSCFLCCFFVFFLFYFIYFFFFVCVCFCLWVILAVYCNNYVSQVTDMKFSGLLLVTFRENMHKNNDMKVLYAT